MLVWFRSIAGAVVLLALAAPATASGATTTYRGNGGYPYAGGTTARWSGARAWRLIGRSG